MNLVSYIGSCGTLYEHGQKFTTLRRSVILDNESVKPFLNNKDYNVVPIKEELIVEKVSSGDPVQQVTPETPVEDLNADKRKKLMKLTAEQLKEMCENAGLSTDGKKEELIDRILAPKE